MDTIKTGKFIADLRHGQGLTQQALGEKLGVSAKTISRWENGNYMPPIDILPQLAACLDTTVAEIIAGERLTSERLAERADKIILDAAEQSSFSLKERIRFRKKKWLREHIALIIIAAVICAAVIIVGAAAGIALVTACGAVAAVIANIIMYNMMMAYVERTAFDGSGGDKSAE